MKLYEIEVKVEFKVHWLKPSNDPDVEVMRKMSQSRMDTQAFALAHNLREIINIQGDS